jgi:hypothetical protein
MKGSMRQVLLRRTAEDSTSVDAVADVVAALQGKVIGRSDPNMLVEVTHDAQVGLLRDQLRGWLVSPQGPTIPVPDTRIKIG